MQAMDTQQTDGTAAKMYIKVSQKGMTYVCFVAYRPIDQIEDLGAYALAQARASFVYESDAQWFCRQFNEAVARRVEPFI